MPVKSKDISLSYLKKIIYFLFFLSISLNAYSIESVKNEKIINNAPQKQEESPFSLLENEIKKQGIIKKSSASPLIRNSSAFCATEGKTLKKVIEEWAMNSSWKLIWEAEYDYPILAAACFTGTFSQASGYLIDAYKDAEHPLYLDIYPSQQVAVISN